MADPIGITLGVAGLAGLFGACVQFFDLIQLGLPLYETMNSCRPSSKAKDFVFSFGARQLASQNLATLMPDLICHSLGRWSARY